jgi:hypothetical protein
LGADLVLLLLPAPALPAAGGASRWPAPAVGPGAGVGAALHLLEEGDVLLPVVPSSRDLNTLVGMLQWAIAAPPPPAFLQRIAGGQTAREPETGCFRLLFLGMDPTPAATLAQRLMDRVQEMNSQRAPGRRLGLNIAGSAAVARDLAGVVREACGWNMSRLGPTLYPADSELENPA